MRTISLRLDDETDAMLRSLCERLDTTLTEVVRRALVLLANSATPTPAELAVELALVGAFASGEHDNAAQHSQRVKAALAARRQADERSGAGEKRNAVKTSAASRRDRPRRAQ